MDRLAVGRCRIFCCDSSLDFGAAVTSYRICRRQRWERAHYRLLSPRYLQSGFSAAEWNAAFQQDPTGEKRLLIPVRIEECDPIQMGLLRSRVYIDLVGVSEAEATEKLLAALKQGRAKPTVAPLFPGSSRQIEHTVSKPERILALRSGRDNSSHSVTEGSDIYVRREKATHHKELFDPFG